MATMFGTRGIPFRMYISHFNGGRYIEDLNKEQRLKSCVFFVRNEDDNCLYAALFLAMAYRDKCFKIDGEEYKFDSHAFKAGRALSNYNERCRTNNLRFFTLKLKTLLE
jgi:hypothetical protein